MNGDRSIAGKRAALTLLVPALLLAAACGEVPRQEDREAAVPEARPGRDTILSFPHEHEGVCPFECCTYGTWTAETRIRVQAFRADTAPVRTVLAPGTSFRAVDGEVWVLTPGTAVLRPGALARRDTGGSVPSPEGPRPAPRDTMVLLNTTGEGIWRVWDGRSIREVGPLLASDPGDAPPDSVPRRAEGLVLRPPETRWWVRVEAPDGTRGWVEMEGVGVTGADACG